MNAIQSEMSRPPYIKSQKHTDVLRRIKAYTNPNLKEDGGAKGVGVTKQISPVDEVTARGLVARDIRIERLKKDVIKAAMIDPLTGLFNRGYLDGNAQMIGELERSYERTKREGLPLGVIMLDIDKFKEVNDTYGHLVGDEVLRNVATLIQKYIRKGDIAVRYGGEEILVLLPDTALDRVHTVAEKLRKAVGEYRYHSDNCHKRPGNVTISLGAMSFDPTTSVLISKKEELINAADEAQYWSKGQGRNRTTIAEETKVGEEKNQHTIWHLI